LHIQALMTLNRITEIYDYNDPKPLTAEQAKTIHDIIDSAMAYAMQYLHVYGELLPDRGGEGHLISYYETTVAFIRAVAANFKNASVDLHDDVYDAPPMPDADVK